MAGFIDFITGYKGDHPKDVAIAYQKLNDELAKSNSRNEDTQWKQLFESAKAQGISPAQISQSSQPQGQTPIERWNSQINGLITSGNPVLQEQGLSMLANYNQTANANVQAAGGGEEATTQMKNYNFALSQGYQGSYEDFVDLNIRGKGGAGGGGESASKPTAFDQKLALYRSDPEAYAAMYGKKDAAKLAASGKANDPAAEIASTNRLLGIFDNMEKIAQNPEMGSLGNKAASLLTQFENPVARTAALYMTNPAGKLMRQQQMNAVLMQARALAPVTKTDFDALMDQYKGAAEDPQMFREFIAQAKNLLKADLDYRQGQATPLAPAPATGGWRILP